MLLAQYLEQPFGTLPRLIEFHAERRPHHAAVISALGGITYRDFFDRAMQVAHALIEHGVKPQQAVAICAGTTSANYAIVFVGILAAGAVVAPLAPSSTPASLQSMLVDCDAKLFFLDQSVAAAIDTLEHPPVTPRVFLDGTGENASLEAWADKFSKNPVMVEVGPDDPFNIIYSSGTTGKPKGIVQPNRFRWAQFLRGIYTEDSVTMISTPLYSNTTLVSFLPTLAAGGTLVLMAKFDASEFLELAARYRATHAMLVPVQYRRIMMHASFDDYDLSSFLYKFSTSAPFAADLKADILRRWPGGLVEFYGMTEGGGSCMLVAHEFPNKLATVGQPMDGHDIRLIDEQGAEVPHGEIGEVVGRSPSMMRGYHNQPEKTREAEWYSPEGDRYIRTGDVGRFDEEGFLTLMDRKKDMIISGGFNIYPSDLEAELIQHPAVFDVAVIGVPSESWGETPVAVVVLKPASKLDPEELRTWFNDRVGKTQRLSALRVTDALPRSAIGKVLKRELRDTFAVLP